MKILMAATDAGASQHLIEVAKVVADRPDVHLTVIVDGAAREIFAKHCRPKFNQFLDLSCIDAYQKRLIVEAQIGEIIPDLVVSGLTCKNEAIDCFVLNAQSYRGGRTAMLLDDCGPMPTSIETEPSVVLATSASVAKWAQKNLSSEIFKVGALKYLSLSDLKWSETRHVNRKARSLSDVDLVVAFFAQDLSLPGYKDCVRSLTTCITQLAAKNKTVSIKLKISLHPAHRADRDWYEALGQEIDCSLEVWDLNSIESSAVSDITVSVCSTALLDAFYCCHAFDFLHPASIYFMPLTLTRDWYSSLTGAEHPFLVDEGGAILAKSETEFIKACQSFIQRRHDSQPICCKSNFDALLPNQCALLGGLGLDVSEDVNL